MPKKPGKKSITSAQKAARRKNIAIARAARGKRSTLSNGKPKVLSNKAYKAQQTKRQNEPKRNTAARNAYKKTYKEVRSFGGSKENARTIALQAAHKKGARWTYKKARTLALGIGRKYGWSKSGVDQFARGFTKALRRSK